jgi:membrane associated rhomboid family serine protease
VFPFIDTAPRASRPIAVFGLIVANAVVFLWMESLSPRLLEAAIVHYAVIPVAYTDAPYALSLGLDPTNFLPMLTDMFMHGGWMHLIFNMWFLWIFGPAMEKRLGTIGFLALYVAGGMTANVVHIATHLDSTEPVIGASGAVAAVIAAYAVTYPWARVLSFVPLGFIPLIFPLPAFLFAFAWFGMQVLQGSVELTSGTMAASVAWWAHIGGFVFGAVVGLIARHAVPPVTTPQVPAPQVSQSPVLAPMLRQAPFPPPVHMRDPFLPQAHVPARVPAQVPAQVPADVWRHRGRWRVPDVPLRYPRD